MLPFFRVLLTDALVAVDNCCFSKFSLIKVKDSDTPDSDCRDTVASDDTRTSNGVKEMTDYHKIYINSHFP